MLRSFLNGRSFFSLARSTRQPTRSDRLVDNSLLMTQLWLTGMGALMIAAAMLNKEVRKKQALPKKAIPVETNSPFI